MKNGAKNWEAYSSLEPGGTKLAPNPSGGIRKKVPTGEMKLAPTLSDAIRKQVTMDETKLAPAPSSQIKKQVTTAIPKANHRPRCEVEGCSTYARIPLKVCCRHRNFAKKAQEGKKTKQSNSQSAEQASNPAAGASPRTIGSRPSDPTITAEAAASSSIVSHDDCPVLRPQQSIGKTHSPVPPAASDTPASSLFDTTAAIQLEKRKGKRSHELASCSLQPSIESKRKKKDRPKKKYDGLNTGSSVFHSPGASSRSIYLSLKPTEIHIPIAWVQPINQSLNRKNVRVLCVWRLFSHSKRM